MFGSLPQLDQIAQFLLAKDVSVTGAVKLDPDSGTQLTDFSRILGGVFDANRLSGLDIAEGSSKLEFDRQSLPSGGKLLPSTESDSVVAVTSAVPLTTVHAINQGHASATMSGIPTVPQSGLTQAELKLNTLKQNAGFMVNGDVPAKPDAGFPSGLILDDSQKTLQKDISSGNNPIEHRLKNDNDILLDKRIIESVIRNQSNSSETIEQLSLKNTPAETKVELSAAHLSHLTAANSVLRKDNQTSSLHKTLDINTPIDKPEWGKEFTSRIKWISENNVQSAELKLHPRHLGSIEVKININNEQANIQFVAPNAHARDMLESSMVRLKEMLNDSGLSLEGFDVSDQRSSDGFERHSSHDELMNKSNSAYSVAGSEEMDSIDLSQEIQLGLVDYYA